MNFNVSIYYLVALAFGRNSIPNYPPGRVNALPEPAEAKYDRSIQRDSQPDLPYASYRGDAVSFDFPIWEQVSFPAGTYKVGQQEFTYPELQLPPATVVDVHRQKTVVKTPVAGRDGTVKELIGAEDWRVRIRGVITPSCLEKNPVGDANAYPYDEVRRLRNLVQLPAALDVVAEIFTTLGIDRLVIENLDLPRLESYPNVQPYTLDCVSDEAVELAIKADNQKINPAL